MPELIPTEQVRADQIKEGDVVWYGRRWLGVTSTALNGDVFVWGLGDWGVDFRVVPTERVLSQAAPASQFDAFLRAVADVEMGVTGPCEDEVCPFHCGWEELLDPGDHKEDCPITLAKRLLASQENIGEGS